MDNECLYRFRADCGRMGYLSGVFVQTEKNLKKLIGKTAYFGEVLGKYSAIEITIKQDHFELLTADRNFIDQAEKYKLVPNGYNPFEYIDPEEWDTNEDSL